jgi:hypothetical protein
MRPLFETATARTQDVGALRRYVAAGKRARQPPLRSVPSGTSDRNKRQRGWLVCALLANPAGRASSLV